MSLTITILGCGSSGGVPRVGQGWGACDPNNPRNRRRRCSIFLDREGAGGHTQVLVDTSPDLRVQLLDLDVQQLDAILMTHPHADHTMGIDDVRPLVLKQRRRIAMHMDAATAEVVRHSFGYIFESPPGSGYPPLLDDHRLAAGVPVLAPRRAILTNLHTDMDYATLTAMLPSNIQPAFDGMTVTARA